MKNSVFCENKYDGDLPIDIENIEKLSCEMLDFALKNAVNPDFLNSYDYNFEILLCDDNFIHQINRDYRQIDRPTDVITFALFADNDNKLIIDNTINLGQIIISIDKTIKQAKENEIPPENELLNLLAHGILHLLGIDHPTEEDLEKMLEIQNKMIESTNYVKI